MLRQMKNLCYHHDDKTRIVYLLIVIGNDGDIYMFDLLCLNQTRIPVTFQFFDVKLDLNKNKNVLENFKIIFDIQSCGNKSIVPLSSLTSTRANISFPPNCSSRRTRFVLTNFNGLTQIVDGVSVTDGT
jgi:hypothetical protein